jgi:fumarylacetoacetase
MGEPVSLTDAESSMFGLCLVNDWSARDIQRWEYQPLGPFLGKSFGTTISPWILTMEALAPFRVPSLPREEGDPSPLPYLFSRENAETGGVDIILEVHLQTPEMRRRGLAPARLSRGRFRDLFWTLAQMVTHHTSNGCNLRTGDMIASGTVSGSDKDSGGCLVELTRGGKDPLSLPSGEVRGFLLDGDEVILRGRCEREGFTRIGFGECRGRVIG